jgi:4a-hydroxytetrahydrobiopterin dehydratase
MKEYKILSPVEARAELRKLPGWISSDDLLIKVFNFKDFTETMAFINDLVPTFEASNHHPGIHIFYNRISFDLTSHEADNRVTDLDYKLAQEIEYKYQQLKREP